MSSFEYSNKPVPLIKSTGVTQHVAKLFFLGQLNGVYLKSMMRKVTHPMFIYMFHNLRSLKKVFH
jgi:hypothetical protein